MWKKLLDPQSYGLAVVFAVVLHIVVIALFAIEWPEEKRRVADPTPKNIQAKVIQTESKAAKKRKLAEEKRLKNENWKKYLAKKKAASKHDIEAKRTKLEFAQRQQKRAQKLFKKNVILNNYSGDFLVMPSTSPANAATSRKSKLDSWQVLKSYI